MDQEIENRRWVSAFWLTCCSIAVYCSIVYCSIYFLFAGILQLNCSVILEGVKRPKNLRLRHKATAEILRFGLTPYAQNDMTIV